MILRGLKACILTSFFLTLVLFSWAKGVKAGVLNRLRDREMGLRYRLMLYAMDRNHPASGDISEAVEQLSRIQKLHETVAKMSVSQVYHHYNYLKEV